MHAATDIDLNVSLGPLKLSNPITVASGTFGYGIEFAPFVDLNRIGAIVVKGLTVEVRPGHPQPRLVETPSGMLNCIGLQNVGIDVFIREKLPFLSQYRTAVIANINGRSIEDYVRLANILEDQPGVAALEVNVSCPNVKQGGISFGTDPSLTEAVTKAVRTASTKPLIVKLSPNVTNISAIARAAMDGGADILSAINTLLGMAIDVESGKPLLSNLTGGLSGPCIRPVAVRCVFDIHRATRLPVIGMGGIASGRDAVEFMMAGAAAVSIGTENFVRPDAATVILDEMIEFCSTHGILHIRDLTGSVQIPI